MGVEVVMGLLQLSTRPEPCLTPRRRSGLSDLRPEGVLARRAPIAP